MLPLGDSLGENIASGKAVGSRKMLKALTRLGAPETGAFVFFLLKQNL